MTGTRCHHKTTARHHRIADATLKPQMFIRTGMTLNHDAVRRANRLRKPDFAYPLDGHTRARQRRGQFRQQQGTGHDRIAGKMTSQRRVAHINANFKMSIRIAVLNCPGS